MIGIEKENTIGAELENSRAERKRYLPFLAVSFLAFIDSRNR